MGYWDPDSRTAKRISRDIEREYYEKFKQKVPGFYDDSEWWKLVESADRPPVEELPECPYCGAQNVKEAEICVGCGEVLKGKNCVNETCGKLIPASASSCPYCGANQIPIILEPWICKVCKTKNVATDDICKCCHSLGANHPLSKRNCWFILIKTIPFPLILFQFSLLTEVRVIPCIWKSIRLIHQ